MTPTLTRLERVNQLEPPPREEVCSRLLLGNHEAVDGLHARRTLVRLFLPGKHKAATATTPTRRPAGLHANTNGLTKNENERAQTHKSAVAREPDHTTRQTR